MPTNYNILPFCLLTQYLLSSLGLPAYSMFNIVFFWFSVLFHSPFLPTAVCSAVATSASFYTAVLIDLNAVNTMRMKFGYSVPFFMFGDFLIHILPLGLIYFKYWNIAVTIANHSTDVFCGLSSIAIHLLWLHVNNNMNDTYAKLPQLTWLILWNVAVMAHLGTMNLMYIQIYKNTGYTTITH